MTAGLKFRKSELPWVDPSLWPEQDFWEHVAATIIYDDAGWDPCCPHCNEQSLTTGQYSTKPIICLHCKCRSEGYLPNDAYLCRDSRGFLYAGQEREEI